jgi:hypothetical protein
MEAKAISGDNFTMIILNGNIKFRAAHKVANVGWDYLLSLSYLQGSHA